MADTILLEAVEHLTTDLAEAGDLETCLRSALEVAVHAVDGTAGTIFLHCAEEEILRFFYAVGSPSGGAPARVSFGVVGSEIPVTEGIAGEVFRTGEPQVTDDARDDPDHAARFDDEFGFETRNMVTLPLRAKDRSVYGVMQVLNRRRGPFTKDDIRTLQILEAVLWMRNALGAEAVVSVPV